MSKIALWSAVSLVVLVLAFLAGIFFKREEAYADVNVNRFMLVDPELAPADRRLLVMEGYRIMLDTPGTVPQYAGDRLSCTNCHFAAGNTLGGVHGGISLVGASNLYPKKLAPGTLFTLADRINGCFERSLNGKRMPIESRPMKALTAYLEWISTGMAHVKEAPWLKRADLRSHHVANPHHGAQVYERYCSMCHGNDGQGEPRPYELSYPPLWGEHSFNNAAGMHDLSTMASFIYYNMPYLEPQLTVEDALDVSSFILMQPRPHESK
jgi:thiosulfate dehydrogenase